MSSRSFHLLLLTLIVTSIIYPVIASSQAFRRNKIYSEPLYLLAVLEHGGGLVIESTLNVYYPGHGDLVLISEGGSIAEETIISAQYALRLASTLTGVDYRLFDYEIQLPKGIKLEGTSATLAFILGFLTFFTNTTVEDRVGVTGLVAPNGVVGNVSGLNYKYEAALSHGLDRVIGPPVKELINKSRYIYVGEVFTAYREYCGRTLYKVSPIPSSIYVDYINREFKQSYKFFYNQTSRLISLIDLINQTRNYTNTDGYEYLMWAVNFSKRDEWYTAASLAFSSYISTYEYYLESMYRVNESRFYALLETIKDEIKNLKQEVSAELENAVEKIGNASLWTLDIYINAFIRYHDALLYYSLSNATDRIEDLILGYVVSLARLYTSKHWLSLINTTMPGGLVSAENLNRAVHELYELLVYSIKYLGAMNIVDEKSYMDLVAGINGSAVEKFINYTIVFHEISLITQLITPRIFPPYTDRKLVADLNTTLYMVESLFYERGVIPPSLITTHRLLNNYAAINRSHTTLFNTVALTLSILIPEIALINSFHESKIYIVPRTVYELVKGTATIELYIGVACLALGSFIIGYVFGKTSSRPKSYVYSVEVYGERREYSSEY